jgi:hypothetical protein
LYRYIFNPLITFSTFHRNSFFFLLLAFHFVAALHFTITTFKLVDFFLYRFDILRSFNIECTRIQLNFILFFCIWETIISLLYLMAFKQLSTHTHIRFVLLSVLNHTHNIAHSNAKQRKKVFFMQNLYDILMPCANISFIPFTLWFFISCCCSTLLTFLCVFHFNSRIKKCIFTSLSNTPNIYFEGFIWLNWIRIMFAWNYLNIIKKEKHVLMFRLKYQTSTVIKGENC